MESVLAQPLAGVVVLTFDPPGVAALAAVPRDLPLVAVAGARPGIAQAVIDEDAGAAELTGHLLAPGHATVHHVPVPPRRREDGRTRGWRRALREAGARSRRSSPPPGTPPPASRSARLADRPDVTAVFCGNDEIAMGVIRGLAERGAACPTTSASRASTTIPLARLWSPPLTTVRQDFAGLGTRGFQLLLHVINATSDRLYSSERPRLILRASTAAPNPHRGDMRETPSKAVIA